MNYCCITQRFNSYWHHPHKKFMLASKSDEIICQMAYNSKVEALSDLSQGGNVSQHSTIKRQPSKSVCAPVSWCEPEPVCTKLYLSQSCHCWPLPFGPLLWFNGGTVQSQSESSNAWPQCFLSWALLTHSHTYTQVHAFSLCTLTLNKHHHFLWDLTLMAAEDKCILVPPSLSA